MAHPHPDRSLLEPAPFTRSLGVLLAALALLGIACGDRAPQPALAVHRDEGRVVVEVLNATGRSGWARLGTRVLRENGLDVVFYGNADTTVDSTLVLVRRGEGDAGARVARALGTGKVESRPDTLRRVDVSVLLGPDFAPPPDPRP